MMQPRVAVFHLIHQQLAEFLGGQRFALQYDVERHEFSWRCSSCGAMPFSFSRSAFLAIVEFEFVGVAGDLDPVAVGIEETHRTIAGYH